MRTIFTVLLVATIPLLAIAGMDSDIPQDHQAILKGAWTPTPDEIAKALKCIPAFLKDPKGESDWSKKQIEQIIRNAASYRVQFIGIEKDGHRFLRCNFFPAPPKEGRDTFPKWREQVVFVCDGGFMFWQIEYDPDAGKYVNFSSNGDA